MKRIFTSVDLVAVSELKDMLDSAGIACFINNEVSSALAGGIPQAECMPELWIGDDSREAEAIQIKKDWLSPQIREPRGPAPSAEKIWNLNSLPVGNVGQKSRRQISDLRFT